MITYIEDLLWILVAGNKQIQAIGDSAAENGDEHNIMFDNNIKLIVMNNYRCYVSLLSSSNNDV